MKKYFKSLLRLNDQKGVTALLVTVLMVILLSFIALSIDYGYGLVTRNELQNAADAAALAATRELGEIYVGMSYEDQQNYNAEDDSDGIKQVAKDVALKNRAGGKNITINDDEITIGQWDGETKTFTPTLDQPDAVRVMARRDGSANGPITTFFAKIFGKNTMDVRTKATAALTGQSTAGEGGLPLPVGISRYRFETEYCDQPIRFYPTNDPESCGGWHTYTDGDTYDANAHDLGALLDALKNGTYQSPAVQAGDTAFTFTGGTLASVFENMKALFDAMKGLNDGILDRDENSNTWTTTVVVYDSTDCSNPNKSITIVGFAEVTITQVLESPDKIIDALIKCEYVDAGRGSGGDYGTKGKIPGLVDFPNPPS